MRQRPLSLLLALILLAPALQAEEVPTEPAPPVLETTEPDESAPAEAQQTDPAGQATRLASDSRGCGNVTIRCGPGWWQSRSHRSSVAV